MPILGNIDKPETNNNLFEEAFNNMTPEKKEKILRIQRIRRNISRFLSKDEQLEKLKEIINNSEVFSFRNKRNERIDKNFPVFILTWDWNKIKEKYGYESSLRDEYEKISDTKYTPEVAEKYKEDEDVINEFMKKEILVPFTSYVSDYLVNYDRFKEFFENEFGVKLDSEDQEIINNLNIITANIFQSNIRLNSKMYQLIPQI